MIWEEPAEVTIRFSAEEAPYVRERLWHPTQQIRELPDGGIELDLKAGGMFELTRWVLGWGQAAEVIEPPQLRKSVQSAVERVALTYRSRETGSAAPGARRASEWRGPSPLAALFLGVAFLVALAACGAPAAAGAQGEAQGGRHYAGCPFCAIGA